MTKQYRLIYILKGELLELLFSADSRALANAHAEHYCSVNEAVLVSVNKA